MQYPRTIIAVFVFVLLFLFASHPSVYALCDDEPLIVQESYGDNPNVMIILDNSGSMNGSAYSGYDSSKTYYGYWDAAKSYSYKTITGVLDLDGDGSTDNTYVYYENSSGTDGNYRNYSTMMRINVARMVLTGGPVVSFNYYYDSSGTLHTDKAQLYIRQWRGAPTSSYLYRLIPIDSEPTGVIHGLANLNLALTVFNKNNPDY